MMIASATLRRCLVKQAAAPHQLRWMSSVTPGSHKHDNDHDHHPDKHEQRRAMHQTSNKADIAAELAAPSTTFENISSKSSTLVNHFIVTAEVTVSKIFPAGFGWQSFSILADEAGMAADSLSFAATTGFGDALDVFGGHCLYYATKKAALPGASNINMKQEVHNGILLGSAAFCSGTAWQPLVNALQGADLPFASVMAGTWIGCGAAFYAGLRVARTILHETFQYIDEPIYDNAKTDASLSVAIGGATGFFVGTDVGYLSEQNFLIDAVGIHDATPALAGCAIAGTSTSLGFLSSQTALNLLYPKAKCWND